MHIHEHIPCPSGFGFYHPVPIHYEFNNVKSCKMYEGNNPL